MTLETDNLHLLMEVNFSSFFLPNPNFLLSSFFLSLHDQKCLFSRRITLLSLLGFSNFFQVILILHFWKGLVHKFMND